MTDRAILLWVSALATGAMTAMVFRRFAGGAAMAVLRRRLWAHVLGLHLFGEEPAAAFDSLREIVKTNGRMLWRALPAVAIAGPLVALVLWLIQPLFTATPLQFGQPAVLTVNFEKPLDQVREPVLHPPPWVRVDAPPVHIPRERAEAFRLQAVSASGGELHAADLVDRVADVASATLTHFPVTFRFLGVRMAWEYWFGLMASLGVILPGMFRRASYFAGERRD